MKNIIFYFGIIAFVAAIAYAGLGDLFLSQDGTKIVWPSGTTGVLMDDSLNSVVIGNLPDETQVLWTSVGFRAGLDSIGDGVAVFGANASRRSASDGLSAFGTFAGENNTGFRFSVFGTFAGTNNDGDDNTALGAESFTDFNLDTDGTVQITVTDTDDDLVTTSPAHGLGGVGTYWNMKAEAVTGDLPTGLNTGPDIWKVIDATTLQLFSANFTGAETGITTLTPQFIYDNSTAVGHDAEPDASNQVMLGDSTLTEVKTAGNITIHSTSGTDAVFTMDGTSDSPGAITYESDNDLFISDKDWQMVGLALGGNLIIPDDGLIGSVSDPDSITIDSTGNVAMSQDLAVTGTGFLGRLLAGGVTFASQSGNDFSSDVNCVALWKHDDGALTTDSRGTNTLTNFGVVADTGVKKEGDASGLYDADRQTIADADLDSGFPFKNGGSNTNMSIALWYRPTDVGSFATIIAKYSSSPVVQRNWVFQQNNAGVIRFVIYYNSGTQFEILADSGTTLVNNQWYHIGFTINDGTGDWRIRIWDDNGSSVAETTGTATNGMTATVANLTIGGLDVSPQSAGYHDEVAIFNDILTADEIDDIRSNVFLNDVIASLHVFSQNTLPIFHVADSANNVAIAGDIEVRGNTFFGGENNFSKIDSSGDISGSDLDISAGTGDYTTTGLGTFANLSLGTGELTAGSINRAADTLTLEIAGTPELSISTDLVAIANGLTVDTDVLVVDAVADTVNGAVFFGDAAGNYAFGNSTTMDALTSGTGNVAVGNGALTRCTEGLRNFALGENAAAFITTADDCVAIGANALFANILNSANVAIGAGALISCRASSNTAVGKQSLMGDTSGTQNVGIGTFSGLNNKTGNHNILIGYEAGKGVSNNSFSDNVFIGYQAGIAVTTGSSNLFLGYKSGTNQTSLSDLLIFDNQDRGSAAAEITDALIYGVFNATPANQSLRINGEILGSVGAKIGDGGATNYTQISATGDLSFAGSGGLIYGHMDIPDVAVITIDTSGTVNPVEVKDDGTASVDDGWETGILNGTVFAVSDLHYITITIPGTYKVLWGMSVKTAAGAGTEIHGGITIDSTTFVRNNGEGHAHVFNANDDINVCSMGVIDCPNGNEEISLWVSSDQNQKTVIEHGNMYIEQIGGT